MEKKPTQRNKNRPKSYNKNPKIYKLKNWKIDHPFIGLEPILKCVIRHTQKDFPDKTSQERFHDIMNLLIKEKSYPQKSGTKTLGFKDENMDVWGFFILIAEERVKYRKNHSKDLPVKEAIRKHIHIVNTHAADIENAVGNWSNRYRKAKKELGGDEAFLASRKAKKFYNEIISNREQSIEENFQHDRHIECQRWKKDILKIKKFLRSHNWPI